MTAIEGGGKFSAPDDAADASSRPRSHSDVHHHYYHHTNNNNSNNNNNNLFALRESDDEDDDEDVRKQQKLMSPQLLSAIRQVGFKTKCASSSQSV